MLFPVYPFLQSSHILAARPHLLEHQTRGNLENVAAVVWIHCPSRQLSSATLDVNQFEVLATTPPSNYPMAPFLSWNVPVSRSLCAMVRLDIVDPFLNDLTAFIRRCKGWAKIRILATSIPSSLSATIARLAHHITGSLRLIPFASSPWCMSRLSSSLTLLTNSSPKISAKTLSSFDNFILYPAQAALTPWLRLAEHTWRVNLSIFRDSVKRLCEDWSSSYPVLERIKFGVIESVQPGVLPGFFILSLTT